LRRAAALAGQRLQTAEVAYERARLPRMFGEPASACDLETTEQDRADAQKALDEARCALAEKEAADAAEGEAEGAAAAAHLAPAYSRFRKRHKPAVKRLRAAFLEFLNANASVQELEREAARTGLASTPMFSWGGFRRPRPGASLDHISQWITKTEDYLK